MSSKDFVGFRKAEERSFRPNGRSIVVTCTQEKTESEGSVRIKAKKGYKSHPVKKMRVSLINLFP